MAAWYGTTIWPRHKAIDWRLSKSGPYALFCLVPLHLPFSYVKIDCLHSLLWRSKVQCNIALLMQAFIAAQVRPHHVKIWWTSVLKFLSREWKLCRNVTTIWRSSFIWYAGIPTWIGISEYRFQSFSRRSFLARDVILYISHLCYDVSVRLCVRLSVTEVRWRIIIANFGFKFRSNFTAHCGRGEGSSQQQHLVLC